MTLHDDIYTGTFTQSKLDEYRHDPNFRIEALDARRGLTALSTAALKGQTETVRLLLESGAKASTLSKGERTPVWFAVAASINPHERQEIVRQLIDTNDVDVDQASKVNDGMTPLMKAVVDCRDPVIISMLVDAGARPDKQNNKKETAQMLAERTKDQTIIHALLEKSRRKTSNADSIMLIVKFMPLLIMLLLIMLLLIMLLLIMLIVKLLLPVIESINSGDMAGIAKDLIKDLQKMNGEVAPEIKAVSECV